jgi:hypothetical protein
MVFDCDHRASDVRFQLPILTNDCACKEKRAAPRTTIEDQHKPLTFAKTDQEHFQFLRSLNERMRKFWGQKS